MSTITEAKSVPSDMDLIIMFASLLMALTNLAFVCYVRMTREYDEPCGGDVNQSDNVAPMSPLDDGTGEGKADHLETEEASIQPGNVFLHPRRFFIMDNPAESTSTVPFLPVTNRTEYRKGRSLGHAGYSPTTGLPLHATAAGGSGLTRWLCGALLLLVLVVAGYLVSTRKVEGHLEHPGAMPADSADTARLTSLRVSASTFAEASSRPSNIVWVTGYQPFKDFTFNPSAAVASSLNGSCTLDYCIQAYQLPVDHTGASEPARWLRDPSVPKPAAIVLLGLEDRAKGLKLEIAAKNVLADSNSSLPIIAKEQYILPSTAKLGYINTTHTEEPLEWSVDAGNYYCNEIYFRTLSEIRSQGLNIPTIFVHLPEPSTSSVGEDDRLIRHIISQLLL
ncbi:hypothetical protein FOL47_008987 [Perkinsus chesapeaki]|uniref:Pyroglutamyl-peptidase 1 n=1 Tax=Perkinsus chesapeaki TaxID=330153 RepID=A0A7J6MT42_PERCH|nr:hypothetical protein FOL47_008987 [Perkinsus chesapeaki]